MASPALIFLILMISSLSRALYGVILDVRLANGNKPNEGTILYTEDNKTWNTSCGQHHNERNEADVICRHLGYPATNRAIQNSPFGDCDPPNTQIKCNGDEKNVSECSVTKCSPGTSPGMPGGVTCYERNYLGCFYDDISRRVLDGEDKNQSFIGLTIAKCLEFCRRNDKNVLAGVELAVECYCSSDTATNLSRQASDGDCNHECDGSATENCGGKGKIAIFNLTADPTPSTQPIETPCDTIPDMTSSTMSSTTVQSSTHDTPDLSTEMGTSDEGITASSKGMTFISSSPPGGNKAPYGAIGGGVAVAVCVVMVIIVIITLRRKSKEKEDQKYGICEKTSNTSASHGYENSIVGFHEATDGDKTEDLYGVVEKDAFSAQMKRGTMIVDYVNVKGGAGNTPAVVEPDHSYANMAADTTGNDAMTSKDVDGSDELYAMSTKHRLGPDGREVAKQEADMYAVPDKGRKSQLSHNALGKSHPVEEADDAGDLYAMPDKNRRSMNALTSSRSDDIELMYAMPEKPRFGQSHDDDPTEMVENELYG